MIIEHDGRSAAVRLIDEPSADYHGQPHHRTTAAKRPAEATPAMRVTVETRCRMGGLSPRALLGGYWTGNDHPEVALDLIVAGAPLTTGQPTTCHSDLGRPFVPGLPEEFATAILDTLAPHDRDPRLPAGTLVIDRAGHDELDSSEWAFSLTAGVLAQVITAISTNVAEPVRHALASVDPLNQP